MGRLTVGGPYAAQQLRPGRGVRVLVTVVATCTLSLIALETDRISSSRSRVIHGKGPETANSELRTLSSALELKESCLSHGHNLHTGLKFPLGVMTLGCVLQVVQERWFKSIPYTCMLFVAGLVLSYVHHHLLSDDSDTSDAIDMWENVDPHFILFAFLPALVFADAMNVNIAMAGHLAGQIFTLACPGVVIGTALTATFVKYVLPYGFDWATSLVFGSILAATDPVAVVSLFNTLGVSPRLTLLISGESLLNDGTAIVLFGVFERLMLGENISVGEGVVLVLRMTLLAVLLGILLGRLFLIIVRWCSDTKYDTDPIIQVTACIACAYLSFYIAEEEVKTSGVLTVVTAGCVFSYSAWTMFESKEFVHTVWESMEFVGNTLIFVLAGLLFGHTVITRRNSLHIYWSDFGWLLVVYLAATLMRALMILMLWPFLNCVGQKLVWQDLLVMTWSGLRGAVGLLLAITVDIETRKNEEKVREGSLILFHVGGMAMLTIVINAISAAPLLRRLGFTQPPLIEAAADEYLESWTRKLTQQAYNDMDGTKDHRLEGAPRDIVQEYVPDVGSSRALSFARYESEGSDENFDARLEMYRKVFMRFVSQRYWVDIEEGLIPKRSKVAHVLLQSTQHVLDHSSERFDDWGFIEESLSKHCSVEWIGLLLEKPPLVYVVGGLADYFPTRATTKLWTALAGLSHIEAHKAAAEQLPRWFGKDSVLGEEIQEEVRRESQDQVDTVEEVLLELYRHNPQVVQVAKGRMLAGRLLQLQLEKVAFLRDNGLLSDKGAHHLEGKLRASQRQVAFATTDVLDGDAEDDDGDSSSE